MAIDRFCSVSAAFAWSEGQEEGKEGAPEHKQAKKIVWEWERERPSDRKFLTTDKRKRRSSLLHR